MSGTVKWPNLERIVVILWTSVDDEMPPTIAWGESDWVLATDGYTCFLARVEWPADRRDGPAVWVRTTGVVPQQWQATVHPREQPPVTHWRPLPGPPAIP